MQIALARVDCHDAHTCERVGVAAIRAATLARVLVAATRYRQKVGRRESPADPVLPWQFPGSSASYAF